MKLNAMVINFLPTEKSRRILMRFWNGQTNNEDPNFQGRSLVVHTNWMKLLNCKVLSLDGASELDDKVDLVLNEIKMFI